MKSEFLKWPHFGIRLFNLTPTSIRPCPPNDLTAENGWAEGKPDWRAYPEMIQKFRAIAIEGCMKA